MAGIDAALQRLEVIAFLEALRDIAMARRHIRPFEVRNRRPLFRGGHIGPDDFAALDARIRLELDFLAVAALLGFRRNHDALTRDVVFPAVIGTAKPTLFIAAEPK